MAAGVLPQAQQVRAQLERILASSPFAGASRSQQFLRYVVENSLENRDSALKEYTIAIEVFGRKASYDPAIHATVRVEATRLRSRLRDYYGGDGRSDKLLIEMPKGGYRVVFGERPEQAEAPPLASAIVDETADRASAPALAAVDVKDLGWQWVVIAGVLAALIVIVGAWWHARPADAPVAAGHSSELFSARGSMSAPMLSPDAREVAFLWNRENSSSDLYVLLLREDREDQRPLRLTNTAGGFLCCQSWSADGSELAYGYCDDRGGAIYIVPSLGGPSRRVADVGCLYGASGWPMWERDGKSLLIIDSCAPNSAPTLIRLSLASGEKQCLVKPDTGSSGDWGATLSPDQKTVAFIRLITGHTSDIYTLTLANNELHRITNEGNTIWNLMWTPDGQHIVFRSARGGLPAIWRVPASGGAIEKETTYPAVGSISADGRRIVFLSNPPPIFSVPYPTQAQIVRVDLSAAGSSVASTKDVVARGAFADGPQLSPDASQIVFGSSPADSAGSGGEIWKSRLDGSDATQLTSLRAHSGTAHWSPDGQSIAFDTRPGPHSQVYVMDASGRNLRMLIGGSADNVTPSWSHDGRYIYFASNRTGSFQIWKRDILVGSEHQLTQSGGLSPSESYDGKTVYYSNLEHGGLWTVSTAGENERRLLDAPRAGYWGYFAVTATGIYVLDFRPKATISYYDPQRSRLTPSFTMSADPIAEEPGMAASRDGRILLVAEGNATNSIATMEFPR